MVKKASKSTPAKAAAKARRKKAAAIFEEEEKILRQAAIYCLRTFPMLWTVGGIKEEQGDDGSRRWIWPLAKLRVPGLEQGLVYIVGGQPFAS